VTLKLHPGSPAPPIHSIEVEVARTDDALSLLYLLSGEIEQILLPPAASPDRTDGLWQHGCFEAFVRGGDDAGYLEFNFSTSTEWAGYSFSGCRKGMSPAEIAAPAIKVFIGPRTIALSCKVALGGIGLANDWRLNLSAVIEEKSGAKSYWALAHPREGAPDFHHPDCFVLQLPPR
jgi:hypothetical protein